MKKISFFAAMILIVLQSFGQAKSWPYVQWPSDPHLTLEEAVTVLKKAMQGQSVNGARVHSNRAAYETVWGTALYERILNADPSEFHFSTAQGDEPNYGVLNGKAQRADYIDRGLKVLTFHGQVICKIGTNSCMNPTPFVMVSEEPPHDPDLVKVPYRKEIINTSSDGKSEAKATVDLTIKTETPRQDGGGRRPLYSENTLSYDEGIGVFKEGARFYRTAFDDGFQKGRDANCCSDNTTNNQRETIIREIAYRENDEDYDDRRSGRDGPTFGGRVLSTITGAVIAGGIAYGAYRLFNGRRQWFNGNQWQNTPVPLRPIGPNYRNDWPNNNNGFSGPSGPIGGNTGPGFSGGSGPSGTVPGGAQGYYTNTTPVVTTGQYGNGW